MPELRKDPFSDQWVVVPTDRLRRPGDFVREPVPATPSLAPRPMDSREVCPFCGGNETLTPPEIMAHRTGGANQPGWTLRVVPSKFPALAIEGPLEREGDGLFDRMRGVGAHEIVIETPAHALSITDLDEHAIERVLGVFRDRMRDLRRDGRLRYIHVFKNFGAAAGARVEHTHSQLIALPLVPRRVLAELDEAKRHYDRRERCLYCDVIRQETKSGARVVVETDRFVVICPYAARFPFETWVLPKQHRSHYEDIDVDHLGNLAWVLKSTLRRIERALERPAWNLMLHTGPLQEAGNPYSHWHFEIVPKVTRPSGFELGTGVHINPTPPEEAAQFLREIVLT